MRARAQPSRVTLAEVLEALPRRTRAALEAYWVGRAARLSLGSAMPPDGHQTSQRLEAGSQVETGSLVTGTFV